jgi:hypothetical protein
MGAIDPERSVFAIGRAPTMLTRIASLALLILGTHCAGAHGAEGDPKIAVVTTVWRHNAHADVIASRLVQGHTLDGQGEFPKLKLVSAYVDQFPAGDMSRRLAAEHGFTIYDSVAQALTLGGDQLAVDGVLLICEHGDYPRSESGSIQYPKRRLFAEIVQVFEASGRVVPVFSDKHLEDDWQDIEWFYRTAQRLKIPLMAGSSLPTLWRYPAVDLPRGAKLREVVATSYGALDAYGFHALEMVQCLVERRLGGETGVQQVRCLEGDAVWQAADRGLFDRQLLAQALARLKVRPLPACPLFDRLSRRPQSQHHHTRKSHRGMDRSLARCRRTDAIDLLPHAGGPPLHALHVPVEGCRADVSHRPPHVARRTHAPHQWRA